MKKFCQIHGCKSIVKDNKNSINPTCTDVIITNRPISFQEPELINTGLLAINEIVSYGIRTLLERYKRVYLAQDGASKDVEPYSAQWTNN